jgi:hypothetical protein
MFVDLTYLHIYDNESNDEEVDENHFEEPWIVDMCEFMTPNDTSLNVEKKKDHNQLSSSSTPMEKSLAQMGDIMQKNHQRIQKRWGSTHRPHHIITMCYCN